MTELEQWEAEARAAAARRLRLLPWEFDQLTPQETRELLEGERDRREFLRELAAWQAVWIVNGPAWMRQHRRGLTVADLMGPEYLRRVLEARAQD